ncbi:Eco29kI family restriction endonuclease [Nonomuraea sp. B1E8]|uniref:Eco29kI family restriction endonuclease n=1 Tax=unclassified Nonomuraea TaxID=2593643 RepID=UPI00325DC8A7
MPLPPPASMTGRPKFDPLSLDQLSRNLREALDGQRQEPLESLREFPGAGLYALYYTGDHPLYAELKGKDIPLYVGKAEAGNSSYGDPPDETKSALFDRVVGKHRLSIAEASENLSPADFDVRLLPLDDVWIVLGERALLRAYAPVLWNTLMPGFGANAAGSARNNARSIWDSIHPGRPRAQALLCNRRFTRTEMETRIQAGISVVLLDESDPARESELRRLRRMRANMIWSPARKGASDSRLRVYRVEAFLEENAAFGRRVDPDQWVAAADLSDAQPDPEEVAEANTLAAETDAT